MPLLSERLRRRARTLGELLACAVPRAPLPVGPQPGELLAALQRLDEVSDGPREEDRLALAERPVFVLATGWRTGSTLLQRILVTDPRLIVWGEPLTRLELLPRLAAALVEPDAGWPWREHWFDRFPGRDRLARAWTANLYPPAADFRAALRRMALRWLAQPARAAGYERWGLKETRCGATEAVLLRWLFPRADILVALRHPADALRSVAAFGSDWRMTRSAPYRSVDSPGTFARHWNELATSWRALPARFGHRAVRFEDVVTGRFDFRALEAALDLRLDEAAALQHELRGSRKPMRGPLTWAELAIVRREAADGLAHWGYRR